MDLSMWGNGRMIKNGTERVLYMEFSMEVTKMECGKRNNH